jgi:hypothetical protein
MNSIANQQKSDIQGLNTFLNDSAWMELYGYNTFSSSELTKLYEHLKKINKKNPHRQELVKEALILFPHRAKGKGGNKFVVSSLLVGVLFVVVGIGAFMIWG